MSVNFPGVDDLFIPDKVTLTYISMETGLSDNNTRCRIFTEDGVNVLHFCLATLPGSPLGYSYSGATYFTELYTVVKDSTMSHCTDHAYDSGAGPGGIELYLQNIKDSNHTIRQVRTLSKSTSEAFMKLPLDRKEAFVLYHELNFPIQEP